MSLYGALFAGVSALNAQSQSMGMISDNISNVNTVGYKRSEAAFSSLVTAQGRSVAYSPGAVRASTLQRVDQQGILQQSSSSTDIALSGNGFFVVKNSVTDNLQEPLYTRAGQFSEDNKGFLVNPAGKFLMGWPVDQAGNIPAGSGDISSLVPVDVAFLGGITRPTATAKVALNLDATQTPFVYPLATPATQTANFSRAIRVYDSLGQAQDVTMKFFHTTSPTATMAGNANIQTVTNLMNQFPNIASTATYTSTVPVPGTLGALAPGLTLNDSFVIKLNNETATISLDPSWNMNQLVTAINSAFTGSPAANVGNELQMTANTPIQISYGGSQPASQSNLNAIGIDFVTQNRAPRTFTLTPGANPTQTITINDGDSAADLVAQINALPDLNAQFDSGGHIVIATNTAGENLVVGGVGGGGNQITAAGFTDLGFVTGTYPPPASPNLLTTLGATANPQNWWDVEFSDPNGLLLSSGMLNFNGDGSINASTQPATLSLANINWGNGSNLQNIDIDISGFTQYSGNYNVVSTDQDGAALGLRTGVSIDKDGFVIAQFSNGESSKLYKLPIATFANPNGLIAKNGNVYQQSDASGAYNLREAGQGAAGTVESGTLESSNVDLADEFSRMIITQRAYSAGTKIISTADQMLQDLLQLR
jgi:flagellar hook protein FlgE